MKKQDKIIQIITYDPSPYDLIGLSESGQLYWWDSDGDGGGGRWVKYKKYYSEETNENFS